MDESAFKMCPGVQLIQVSASEETQRFHAVVAGMISSQTRDAVTAAAMKRLHAMPGGLTVETVSDDRLTIETLAERLKPVGFYRYVISVFTDKHLLRVVTRTL